MACGVAFAPACATCGAGEIPSGARFCPACGSPVVPETEAPEMIKLVTILFCDVVGSTAQQERLAPEDARALMAEFLEAMSQVIRSEGGTIERYIGDALMADFGVPVAREDDAIRAVRAALKMLARVEEWNRGDPARQMQIRIGINTGEVSTGGSFGRKLLVMGDAVNVAARLEQIAAPGSVVVGPRTERAVRKHFELQRLDPIALKGVSESVSPFVVIGERAVIEGVTTSFEATLVGRKDELQVLQDHFDQVVREETPQLLTLIGDPGIGKTRLISEFATEVAGDATVLYGRCLPAGGVTLWPLREILRALADLTGTDSPEVALDKIKTFVGELLTASEKDEKNLTSAALASSIGIEAGLETFAGLDPRDVYREVLRAWRLILSSMASRRPTLMVIEDLHWAEETTLGLLHDLERHAEGPILIVCPARPELLTSNPEWPSSLRSYSSLVLEPLNLEHSAQLVKSLLRIGDLPEPIRYRILERGEGNPFFIEEILQRLMDAGYLQKTAGGWEADEKISEVEIPDNIQAVILSRLDLLNEDERRVIQQAAVVGRIFWVGALRHLLGPEELDDILRSLRRRQLIADRVTSSLAGEEEYIFKHVLIRDVAYESLPRTSRGHAHAAAAQWIEKVRGERATEVAELMSYHYMNAFHFLQDEAFAGEARAYSLIAARSALRRFAIAQAEVYGQQAVGLSVESRDRIDTLEALGDIYHLSSKGDDAWAAFSDALEEASANKADNVVVARIAAKAAIIPTRFVGLMDTSLPPERVRKTIDVGLAATDDVRSRERSLLLLSRAFLQAQGYEEPDEHGKHDAEAALDIAEELGDPDLISGALDAIAGQLYSEGRHGDIARITQRRLDLIPRLRDVYEISDIHGTAAYTLTFIGRYEEAARHATLSMEYAQRASDVGGMIHALNWRSQARCKLGDWDGVLDDQAHVERLEDRGSGEMPAAFAIRSYGAALFCHEMRGERAETERLLRIFRRYYGENVHSGLTFLGPLALPARALAHNGHPEEARSWLLLDGQLYLATHLEAACDIVAARGAWDEAPELVARARAQVARGDLEALACFADRLEGQYAAASGDRNSAETLLHKCAAGFARLGARWEEAFSRLLLARVLAESGSLEAARTALSAARITFEALGSVRELEECVELLADVPAG